MPKNSLLNIVDAAQVWCAGSECMCPQVHEWNGPVPVFQCWACDTGAMRALTSGLMRHRFNPCLVAAAGIPAVNSQRCLQKDATKSPRYGVNRGGGVGWNGWGVVVGGGVGWLAGRGRVHPLCVKLHIRTVELIHFLAPALLEVCQTRLWHVHSVLTDFKHASHTFRESGGAIKYNLRIIWCKWVKTENDATLWKMHFHFIFHRMRTLYCSFAIKWS